MFKEWNEYHNWSLICIAIILLVLCIGVNARYVHEEDLKHIEMGHCKVSVIGSETQEWQICK